MAYRQYTDCVDPSNYINLGFTAIGWRNIFILVWTGAFAVALIAIFAGGPVTLIAFIAFFIAAVAYLYWWLNGRLICLKDEPCLIGMVRGLSAADPLEKAGDDDFSMNVLLAPGPTAFRTDHKQLNPENGFVEGPPPPISEYQGTLQGRLVSPQPPILAIGRTYVTDEGHSKYVTGLHCEFEGSGIHNLLIWAGIVLALLLAALALMLFVPALGWLITLLVLLAILFGGTGLLTGPLAGPLAAGAGHPTDVDPALRHLAQGDIVVVKGEWIYDSLHHGWNEIHPIRDCCIIGKGTLGAEWPDEFKDATTVQAALDRWCRLLDDARGCEDGGSRTDPKNDWVIHPLVDGCETVIIT
jgi:hypothetical protein